MHGEAIQKMDFLTQNLVINLDLISFYFMPEKSHNLCDTQPNKLQYMWESVSCFKHYLEQKTSHNLSNALMNYSQDVWQCDQ